MSLENNTIIAEGFDELESEIQAREAQQMVAETNPVQSGAVLGLASGVNAGVWAATKLTPDASAGKHKGSAQKGRVAASYYDDILPELNGRYTNAGYFEFTTKMGTNKRHYGVILQELAGAEGVTLFEGFSMDTASGEAIESFTIETSEKGRAFLKKYMKPDGSGLTDEAFEVHKRLKEEIAVRKASSRPLSGEDLKRMGVESTDKALVIGKNMGSNAQTNVRLLYEFAKREGLTVHKIAEGASHPESYRLVLENSPKAHAFLRKYVTVKGAGLTPQAQQLIATGALAGNDVFKRMGADIQEGEISVGKLMGPQAQKNVRDLYLLAEKEGLISNKFTDTNKTPSSYRLSLIDTPEARVFLQKYVKADGTGLTPAGKKAVAELTPPAAARGVASKASKTPKPKAGRGSSLSGIKGTTVKWGLRGMGVAFNAWAAYNFVSDVAKLGTAGGATGADGVALQNAIPSQFAGKIAPRDSKYFAKGSPEEMKFRAMVTYACMQEGGFMGKTQEEWQEYAVRLAGAEGGIISPTGELKIRKGLVAAYDKYQATVDKSLALNLGGNANSDATRGFQNAGAEAVGAGRGAPAASRRREGSRGDI